MERKIFANHAHVYPKEWRPFGTVEALGSFLDDCEIEKAVCFAPFPYIFEEMGVEKNTNQFLYNEMKNQKRFVGFGTINFEKDNLTDQVQEIYDLGFKGIKIHPAAQEINIMGKKACEVYKKAEELNLFISFHTGIHWHRISDYNVLLFDEVAFNFPALKFSMEHIGGSHFFNEALAVMANNSRNEPKNVYGGWTSVAMPENGIPDFWSLTDQQLLTVVNQTGYDTCIFGLDFPFKNADYVKKSITRIENLDLSEEAKAAILGKNLAEILNVEF